MATGTALADIVEYSTSYKADGMRKALDIDGYEPAAAGTYPVFVWICGTGMNPWNGDDQIICEQMAERGFVTMSVDYQTRRVYPGHCVQMNGTVAWIFDELDSASAINVVGARAKADLSLGVVVAGFSQGANLASLSKNYYPGVEAAYLIGNGYQAWGETCYDAASTDLPGSRQRSIMGAYDAIFEMTNDPDANRLVMETTTGYSCGSTAMSCISGDDSGWYLVQAFETADNVDDHCFYGGDGSCGAVPLDAEFEFGTQWWSLNPSLDWLASFAGSGSVCGDATCDPGEDQCNCSDDCGTPPATETNCTDGIDEDCDGGADCADPTGDCDSDPACQSACNNNGICEPGEDCNNCGNDCDSKTNGPPNGRYCCGDGVADPAEGDGTICDGNY